MESFPAVSLQDIANIITFIAPGYFAISIYSFRFAKSERDFSRILVESIAWSLILVAVTNYVWLKVLGQQSTISTDTAYVLLLLLVSVTAGYAAGVLRERWLFKYLAGTLGIGSPDEDFLRQNFTALRPDSPITITLKSGNVFSGTPKSGSIYKNNGSRKYRFDYVAWYDKKEDTWIEEDASIIIDMEEVEYIVLPKQRKSASKSNSLKSRFYRWRKG